MRDNPFPYRLMMIAFTMLWIGFACGDSSNSNDDDMQTANDDDDPPPPPPGDDDDDGDDLPPPPPPGGDDDDDDDLPPPPPGDDDDDDDDLPPPPPPGDDDDDDDDLPPPPPGDDDDDDDDLPPPPPGGDDDDDDFPPPDPTALSYPVVDTGQDDCYDDHGRAGCSTQGQANYGQDAQYEGLQPAYRSNGDDTVSDLNTGLTWTSEVWGPISWEDAIDEGENLVLGGYSDWRLPSIKELYSLIDFRGQSAGTDATIPYIDDSVFEFFYGDPALGQRTIDVQEWTSTYYIGTTMNGSPTTFGVNFADGRIKGYGRVDPRTGGDKTMYARFVRGNSNYGVNDFFDNGDETIADQATGLVWQKADDGSTRDWPDALAYCEGLTLASHSDWRLPNAKELQSIVDYSRSPTITGEAAIDPAFDISDIESYFWSSTSHLDGIPESLGDHAVYVAFGRAMGYMEMPPGSGQKTYMDVHGAGAQRSDPKTGDPSNYPEGRGPQGDDVRIYNYVRCVRTAN